MRTRMRSHATWLLAIACVAGPALAQDAKVGRQKAGVCAACHGPLGLSATPDAPNLAGQPAEYISAQLKAYRGGTRKHEVMSLMAKPLSDTDIDNLAAWFSALKVQVTPP